MARIENMSLGELLAFRERLWAEPLAAASDLMASLDTRAMEKFMQGEAILVRGLANGLIKRVEALESRLKALETKH
ncbi:hypothetical protein [Bosea sp. (in: a-proteobacteria)]|uniref:hypothetical protein n=1 Tax=Bosea sp. (in: a-proteobacteria) TaxID=1871050 RepID=UPI0027369F94|nr:hypothetical protein [Bosea sp. (in: a-proteobacteria)]MDP3410724.1 hypothetical protein [Bosea sp. (in: a-proteobacteria)]